MMSNWWAAIERAIGTGRPQNVLVGEGVAPWEDETQRHFLPWSEVVPDNALRVGSNFESEHEATEAAWMLLVEDEDGFLQWAAVSL